MIIFESLLIILQQHHVLLKAIASLLRICCQKSYLPLQEWCCNYITEPPPGQAPGPRLHHSAAPCPYEGATYYMVKVQVYILGKGHHQDRHQAPASTTPPPPVPTKENALPLVA